MRAQYAARDYHFRTPPRDFFRRIISLAGDVPALAAAARLMARHFKRRR